MLKMLLSAVPLDPRWFGKWGKPIVITAMITGYLVSDRIAIKAEFAELNRHIDEIAQRQDQNSWTVKMQALHETWMSQMNPTNYYPETAAIVEEARKADPRWWNINTVRATGRRVQ